MKRKIGIIGCGNIAQVYLEDFVKSYHQQIEVIACADIVLEKAQQTAARFAIPMAGSVEELLSIPEIDIVVNLTIPAVHTKVNKMILEAGKHVYCEKPLALTMDEAKEVLALAKQKGLRVACAPDTFMGPALQTCKKLIDGGWIGQPIAASTNIVGWGPETWHPNPQFFYQHGGGPLLDMGPYAIAALVALFGPMQQMQCIASRSLDKRLIYSEPHRGAWMDVDVSTHYSGSAKMANGVIVSMNMSFDIWKSSLPALEVYGTEGTLQTPHPADFTGEIKLFRSNGMIDSLEGRGEPVSKDSWYQVPLSYSGSVGNRRGLGVVDLSAAIEKGRQHRTNEDFILHCTEILLAFDKAATSGEAYVFETTCQKPDALPCGLAIAQVD